MTNLLSRVATGAVDAVLFGVGLVHGAARAVVDRVRSHETSEPEPPEPWVPAPRDEYIPAPPEDDVPDPDDVDVITPVGTTGAAPGYNPSTAESDLQQPGTEQIMEPSTTKRVKAETDVLRRGAERNPE